VELDKNLSVELPVLESLKLAGLNIAVIGGTGGIGRAFSHLLAAKGAQVLVVGQTFRDEKVPGIKFMKADLSLMWEAKRVANELPAETLDMVHDRHHGRSQARSDGGRHRTRPGRQLPEPQFLKLFHDRSDTNSRFRERRVFR
jgi:hypothetical protein